MRTDVLKTSVSRLRHDAFRKSIAVLGRFGQKSDALATVCGRSPSFLFARERPRGETGRASWTSLHQGGCAHSSMPLLAPARAAGADAPRQAASVAREPYVPAPREGVRISPQRRSRHRRPNACERQAAVTNQPSETNSQRSDRPQRASRQACRKAQACVYGLDTSTRTLRVLQSAIDRQRLQRHTHPSNRTGHACTPSSTTTPPAARRATRWR